MLSGISQQELGWDPIEIGNPTFRTLSPKILTSILMYIFTGSCPSFLIVTLNRGVFQPSHSSVISLAASDVS